MIFIEYILGIFLCSLFMKGTHTVFSYGERMAVSFSSYLSLVSELFIYLCVWANSSAMAADINLCCH